MGASLLTSSAQAKGRDIAGDGHGDDLADELLRLLLQQLLHANGCLVSRPAWSASRVAALAFLELHALSSFCERDDGDGRQTTDDRGQMTATSVVRDPSAGVRPRARPSVEMENLPSSQWRRRHAKSPVRFSARALHKTADSAFLHESRNKVKQNFQIGCAPCGDAKAAKQQQTETASLRYATQA
jgi:hypothetical protein